jgi:hypothetical protein
MMVFDVNKIAPERKLARLADVAARAGVSTATADRVLNRRPGVRANTAQKVFKAALELDYLPRPNRYGWCSCCRAAATATCACWATPSAMRTSTSGR